MADLPQITQNIICPDVVPVLNTEFCNVRVVSGRGTPYSLLEWLTTVTGKKIPARQCVVFLDSVKRFVELRISLPNENIEGVIPPFAYVIRAVFTSQRI